MKTKKFVVILSIILLIGIFAGCNSNATPTEAPKVEEAAPSEAPAAEVAPTEVPATEKTPLRIAFVTSAAGQNDSGYNKSGCDALAEVATKIGAEYKIVEPENGVPSALESLAEEGYNLIFSLEYDFEALINGVGGSKAIAEQYPETTFVIFNDNPNVNEDGSVKYKNVISVLFDVHEASYLAGYAYVQANENADKLFGEGYNLTKTSDGRAAVCSVYKLNGIWYFLMRYRGHKNAAEEFGVTYDYYAKYVRFCVRH